VSEKKEGCDCVWSDTGHCLCPVSCNDYRRALSSDGTEESKILLKKIIDSESTKLL
jgi:hypothetical protein